MNNNEIIATLNNILMAIGDIEIKSKQSVQMFRIIEALQVLKSNFEKDDENDSK